MKRFVYVRLAKVAAAVVLLAPIGGCQALNTGASTFFEFVQTVLLGITAAGSVAILRNV